MNPIHQEICQLFGVKRRDTVPCTGFGTRETLAELFVRLGYTKGAEIGVYRAEYSKVLCDMNPQLELICVDPWIAFERNPQSRMDAIFAIAKSTLEPYKARIVRKTGLEAAKDVPHRSLDFVYIDGLHDFDSVMTDIITWSPKVRSGGIVAGHDFCHYYRFGVIPAVEAYTRAHSIGIWYLTIQDKEPSWFWVR